MTEYTTIFDEYPYTSLPIAATYPPQLALSSRIHGGPYPSSERFRLLELGCGDGGNLLPLAFYHPDCEFVGFDYAQTALDSARAAARACGLTNVRFVAGDFSAATTGLGSGYDYVVANGVFSWVSERDRNRVLEIARSSLVPDGLACISYNVRPAWAVRGQVRELLMRTVSELASPREQVERAKRLAQELRDRLIASDHPYQVLLATEFGRLATAEDYYVYHEYLCEHNEAYRVGDFASLAAVHGLRYLCDASFNQPEGRLPQALAETLGSWGFDGLELEQFGDALGYRLFRTSVLCRDEAVRLPPGLPPLDELAIACALSPESERPDPAPGVEETFHGAQGQWISTADPVMKTAFVHLNGTWPWPIAVTELVDALARSLPEAEIELDDLSARLASFHCDGFVSLSPRGAPKSAATTGELPHALTTLEARRSRFVTTPFHTLYELGVFDRELVRLLAEHGSADAASTELVRQVETGAIALDGSDDGSPDRSVRQAVDRQLAQMRQWGLLSPH